MTVQKAAPLPAVVLIGPTGTTVADVLAVARHGARVALSKESLAALASARRAVEVLAADSKPAYGISTGFGALHGTSTAGSARSCSAA